MLFDQFGRHLFNETDNIKTFADIGGCFGFGANSMGYHIAKRQGFLPKIMVFELVSEFVNVGKVIFPHIQFVESEFDHLKGDVNVFDLVTLFDVVEHVVDPEKLLQYVAAHSRYVMLKTPMETSGDWRTNKPPAKIGENHPDGHINFFTPGNYEKLLDTCNLEIIEHRLIDTIVSTGARMALVPETFKDTSPNKTLSIFNAKNIISSMLTRWLPFKLARKIVGGGEHICICRSRLFDGNENL